MACRRWLPSFCANKAMHEEYISQTAPFCYLIESNRAEIPMIVTRNPIFQWLASVHDVWNLRRVQLFDMGHGRVGVAGVWKDEWPRHGPQPIPGFCRHVHIRSADNEQTGATNCALAAAGDVEKSPVYVSYEEWNLFLCQLQRQSGSRNGMSAL
jgi:hypothetical protein